RRTLSAAVLCLTTALLFSSGSELSQARAAALQDDEEAFEELVDQYERKKGRPPLIVKAEGWELLTKDGSQGIFEFLLDDYKKPPMAPEFARSCMLALAGRDLAAKRHLDGWREWVEEFEKPEDAWLWVHGYRKEIQLGEPERVVAVVRDSESYPRKAAALEALGREGWVAAAELLPDLLNILPKKAEDQSVLIRGASAYLYGVRSRVESKPVEAGVKRLIEILERPKLNRSDRIVIERHLSKILDVDPGSREPDFWRQLLARKISGNTGGAKKGETVVSSRFFGLQGFGDRVCYVLDLSDSMADGIPGNFELPRELQENPPTNRLELALAMLERSLQELKEDQFFCVIVFGTEATTLKATKGLVPAKAATIKKALAELRKIEVRPDPEGKKTGLIRGDTNLHGALRLAYRLRAKKTTKKDSYVDPKAFQNGVETIFLLSDGAPNVDDFIERDINDGSRTVVDDLEGATQVEGGQYLNYPGPFSTEWYLVEDLERLNLLHKAELHVVGLGEINPGFLQRISQIGLGTVRQLGR
ncbi:MAG: vWA domain-containing protein, partial [Planctomycetota bacterium]